MSKNFFFVFMTTEIHFKQVFDFQGGLNTGIKSQYPLTLKLFSKVG